MLVHFPPKKIMIQTVWTVRNEKNFLPGTTSKCPLTPSLTSKKSCWNIVSDVALLKEGCLKFVKEFEEIAGFNPLIQSITIAAACNYFWRKEKLEEDLIALEPNGGWHGNHINQSQIA